MVVIPTMNDIVSALPQMQTGEELTDNLAVMPNYDDGIRNGSAAERLIALSDLYSLYIPSPMSSEIYSKLYIALTHSLQKKIGRMAIQQHSANFKAIRGQPLNGILGGADSFTIIGTSGIGKSSAIHRAISLLSANGIIEVRKPYTKVIPCIVVQCPFDSSVKGLLLEILRTVDETLGTNYYDQAVKARATIDMLIGSVSQVSLNHIGILIVDEIQNVANGVYGRNLVSMLTQLINNSGISIVMVGTPESSPFFEQAMRLARRAVGLTYVTPPCDEFFRRLCSILFFMQYTKKRTGEPNGLAEWLYEHSNGLISIVVSLIHDAQEIAILNGTEELSIQTLQEAYQSRMTMLHGYITANTRRGASKPNNSKNLFPSASTDGNLADDRVRIQDIVNMAKSEGIDIVYLLGEYITIEEVRV